MGALTLKSFPFELRGWDIEKFESIDPTDGFGSSTRIYINKQQIIQIEPEYNTNNSATWLSDKSRQFFDGLLHSQQNKTNLTSNYWTNFLQFLFKTLYLFDHCSNKTKKNYFFTIVFENISIEILSLLLIIEQHYSFIKLKRLESFSINNDLESLYQLNVATNQKKLNSSDLCFLIANNARYEGYHLNLKLRQRFLKGNFKCFSIGSLIDLTFPSNFIGTNLKILKNLIEGNNLICQDLKSAKNPIIISTINNNSNKINLLSIIKILNYSKIFNKAWKGIDFLNSSIYEAGIQNLSNIESLNKKDLANFSSIYFINIPSNNILNYKKLFETKLLNYCFNNNLNLPKIDKLVIEQNTKKTNINNYLSINFIKYIYLPTKNFYETNDTYINTEGLIKKTSKLFSKKNTKNNWKILRNFLKQSKKHLTFINSKENSLLFFEFAQYVNFKNFIAFNFHVTKKLNNTAFSILTSNKPFFIVENSTLFKLKNTKLKNTKLKYWLNDFFIGGKDNYSQDSLTMAHCSRITRAQTTNFL